ncbi:MAG: radical SAM protein, partial [Candidatus Omnitrophica bacterium]|nr:radical SAM protein [Candidatus Omnitrophota bacterium]
MKILLISIDLVLGTRILVNVLKDKGIKSHILQIAGIKYSDLFSKKQLKDIYGFSKKYDAVGLAFNSFYPILAAQLGRYLKSKGVKWIIAGGPHATAMPEETMGYSDISIIYEAELTLPKVLKSLSSDNSSSFQEINGIAFKDKNGKIVKTGCPRIETNLDNIPFQSFSSKDITYYNFRSGKFDKPTVNNLFPHGGRNYFILTSRGCPFKCTYCCNNLFAKLSADFNKIRKRSVRNIISEMKLAKKSGFKGFYIVDDNFLAFTLEELKEFAKLYSGEINLPFGISGLNPNNMRVKDSDKKIGLLLSCGLSDIRIGVQSGSNKTLKMFQRRYAAEELPNLLSAFENRKTIWKAPND